MGKRLIKILFRRESILLVISLALVMFSFIENPGTTSVENQVKKLESRIHKRQIILEKFAKQALDAPDDKFLEIPDLPSDMVIYRYCADTLNSWVNQFPISNDDIEYFPFGYRINYLTSRGVANTPLAYLSLDEQYVNLGSGWYIVKVHSKQGVIIISALLVQTDYRTESENLKNEINPRFKLSKNLSIVPVTYDEAYTVNGKDGGVLFFVLKNTPNYSGIGGTNLRWIAVILVISALFIRLRKRRSINMFFIFTAFMVIVKFFEIYLSSILKTDISLFSPSLYADFGFSNSLADLFINNLLIVFIAAALFMVRKDITKRYHRASPGKKRLIGTLLCIVPVLILFYTIFSLRSLILNSSIAVELYKIDELSVYTLLVYFSYGTLFIALLYSLQLLRPILKKLGRISFFNYKPLLIYITAISAISLLAVSFYGYQKENNRNRVWTTKMSIERDLNIELQLRSIEQFINNDPVIRISAEIRDQETIVRQLTESYIWGILQKYELRITFCNQNDYTRLDYISTPVHCNTYFMNEINNYGIPLSSDSHFFFMNNYNGRISYLGAFTYPTLTGDVTMFLEFESKLVNRENSYRDIVLQNEQAENMNMPAYYSYAKYLNKRLITFGGDFNYPVVFNNDKLSGYTVTRSDGYVHFINPVSPDNVIIISRPVRSIFPYIVSFSYTMIFFSMMILGLIRLQRRGVTYKLPRNSFRSKITILVIASLIFALFSMGAGSIWYTINYINETSRAQMEEKMESVQTNLSDFSKLVDRYNDPNFDNLQLFATMTRLANNTQISINLYSPDGRLIRTTQQELYENYIAGYRMNPVAFNEIVNNHKKQVMNKERIGEFSYYSLYAPLFNRSGKIIAIVNIPYYSMGSGSWSNSSNIIATIINIYLLLIIAAVLGGVMLSNSLSRPLNEISKKMQLLNVSRQAEHIDYNNKDELGILVSAYNKMVDDLEESTKQLAQSEREQAWREMARQIAHEIKNPLTPMRLSIQHLIRLKQQNVPEWQKKFDDIAISLIEQIDILSEAASEFSSFSRFYSEELTKVDLKALVKEQISLFNTRDNVEIVLQSKTEDSIVIARKGQIVRVLVNLISNAVQAVETLKEGKIEVSILDECENVRLKVEDNGAGVPDELTGKLFKPNFTTKSGGTGLGLYICRSIIEQSQGSISYNRSAALGGACFTFALKRPE